MHRESLPTQGVPSNTGSPLGLGSIIIGAGYIPRCVTVHLKKPKDLTHLKSAYTMYVATKITYSGIRIEMMYRWSQCGWCLGGIENGSLILYRESTYS